MRPLLVDPATFKKLKDLEGAPKEPPKELTQVEMMSIIATLPRRNRRAFAVMRRHGVKMAEAFERCSGFAPRRRPDFQTPERPLL